MVVLALGIGAGASAASPSLEPARKLCRSQGGSFSADPGFYRCVFLDGGTPTTSERRAARRLCEGRYDGEFMFAPAGGYTDAAYGCDFS